jgi:hypothetical protein
MKLGVDAAGYARLKVPKSTNYKFTSSAILLNKKPLKIHTVSTQRDVDQFVAMRSAIDAKTKWEWLCKMSEGALKNGMGNCGELAAVCVKYLKDKSAKDLDYVYVLDGVTMNEVVPHVIAVIGRKGTTEEDADIGLPDTWGSDAVVCDSWDRVVYPAAKYDFYWTGLKKYSTSPADLSCQLVFRVP